MNKAQQIMAGALLTGATLVANTAHAAGVAAVDVADVTSGITAQIPSVTAVAAASLGLYVVVKAFSWVRRALR
jgi:Inovirus Coat protein B